MSLPKDWRNEEGMLPEPDYTSGYLGLIAGLEAETERRGNLLDEAVDLARRNSDEVERLRAEVERLRADQQTYADTYARNMARVNAEVERLRTILEAERKVAFDWCRRTELPLMNPPRAPEAIDQLGYEVERLRRERDDPSAGKGRR